MVMEGFTALPECSRKAQTTPDRARYWLKLLEIETVKAGNIRYVPNGSVDLLGNMARLISNGMTPGEAAKKAKEETPAGIVPAKINEVPIPDNRLEGIEKSLLVMAEKMNLILEENRSLRYEVSLLRGLLPAPVEKPIKKEKAITPAPIRADIMESTQRKVSFWESVRLGLDDCCGFIFGKG